jgi:hypothetical protein
MKIQITNGYVEMNERITRGLDKNYKKLIYQNAKQDFAQKSFSLDMGQIEEAKDYLIYELIEKIMLDDKEVKKTKEWLDELDNKDFEKLNNFVDSLKEQREEEKKK